MKRIEDRIAGFLFFRSGEPDCLRTHGSFPFSAISSSSGGKLFERRYQQTQLMMEKISTLQEELAALLNR
ncbi:hypothetical protein L6452_21349 [Arctium lappa]|uniref:Uncharacterized protein n=1 Tax=Arctium lappa TaxID=4217 RepID=A0ACB9BEC0_ARCLA|nr:hypothetical protein L6452_21349 [Arctium lappa]